MASAAYKIEQNVPLPAKRGSKVKYPFGDMKVGDSFTAPEAERHRIASAAGLRKIRTGMTFSIRKDGADRIRIWRTS